jgi:hypothetical protein
MKRAASLIAAALLIAGAGRAQQTGPMQAPENPPVIKRIPLYPTVPPPPMAPDQIVSHFLANEAAYKQAYATYGFLQTIRVEELGPQGGATGSYQMQTEVYVKAGGRLERILSNPQSSLQYLKLSAQDMETIAAIPLFPLAGDGADYNFTYRGLQKQGELTTYAFQVDPKTMQPGHIYFSGVVWVDNVDLAIVMSYGHFVASGTRKVGNLPFSYFEIYRENVAGKYWFPSYIRSDDSYQQGQNELPIRLVVRASDFQPGQPQLPPPQAR